MNSKVIDPYLSDLQQWEELLKRDTNGVLKKFVEQRIAYFRHKQESSSELSPSEHSYELYANRAVIAELKRLINTVDYKKQQKLKIDREIEEGTYVKRRK